MFDIEDSIAGSKRYKNIVKSPQRQYIRIASCFVLKNGILNCESCLFLQQNLNLDFTTHLKYFIIFRELILLHHLEDGVVQQVQHRY